MADIKAILAAKLAAAKEKQNEQLRSKLADTGLSSGAVQQLGAGSTGSSGVNSFGDSAEKTASRQALVPVGAAIAAEVSRELPKPANVLDTGSVVSVQPTDVVVLERPQVVEGESGRNGFDEGVGLGTATDLDPTNPVHFAFLDRLKQVEETLLARDPMMKTHLLEIHKAMIQHEEIVNLLRPQEIAKIMAAQQTHTNMVLVRDSVKKTPSAAKSLQAKAAKISLDDV